MMIKIETRVMLGSIVNPPKESQQKLLINPVIFFSRQFSGLVLFQLFTKKILISILTYFILEEKRIGIRIGQYESSQQISCGFSKTKIRHFLSISNIYVLFIYSAFSRKQIVFLLFIYFYWSLLVIIGKTNN